MKRGLTLLLASLVLAVFLTACGGDTKNNHNGDSVLDGEDRNTVTDGSQNSDGNGSASGNGNGDSITGDIRDGMDDIRDGVDDAMRDAGDAMDGVMDDLTGNDTGSGAQTTPQKGTGPAWQGNLKKPNYPGTSGRSF